MRTRFRKDQAPSAPYVELRREAAQAIATTTITRIVWDYVVADSGDRMFTGDTITIPESGVYSLTAALQVEASSAGSYREAWIGLNGNTNYRYSRALVYPSASTSALLSMSATARLAVGTRIEVDVYQDSGVTLNVQQAATVFTRFAVVRIA